MKGFKEIVSSIVMNQQKESRTNRYKKIYIWTNGRMDAPEYMVPYGSSIYGRGVNVFTPAVTREDLTTYLTKLADDDATRDVYFAFKRGGPRWKVYRTNEVDLEYESLFVGGNNE
jgi:hypothetical protein